MARKSNNKQTYLERKIRAGEGVGCFVGSIAGIVLDAIYMTKSAESIQNGDYLPLAIWIGTNVISGIYELGRLSKSREEYKALKNP